MSTYRVENLTPDRPRRIVSHGLTKAYAEAEAARLNGYGHDGEYVIGENIDDPYGVRALYSVSAEAASVFAGIGTFAGISTAWEKVTATARDDLEAATLRRAAVNRGRFLRRIGVQGTAATSGPFGNVQTTAELEDLTNEGTTDDEREERRALLAA